MPEVRQKKISKLILALTVTSGLLLTVCTSLFSLYFEYQRDVHLVEREIDRVIRSSLISLGKNLWEGDEEHVLLQLESLMSVPTIRYLKIDNSDQISGVTLGSPVNQREAIASSFPLSYTHNGQDIQLGVLYLQGSTLNARNEALHHLPAIILTQATTVFLVSLLVYFLVHKLVIRHLATMSFFVRHMHPSNTNGPLQLSRQASEPPDELDEVANAINELRNNLQESYAELQATNENLKNDIAERKLIEEQLRTAKTTLENVFDSIIPLCITDTNHRITQSNHSYNTVFGKPNRNGSPMKCYESRPGDQCRTTECPLYKIQSGAREVAYETNKQESDGSRKYFVIHSRPFIDESGNLLGSISSFHDITARRSAEEAREKTVAELQKALAKVKLLSGFLPICASCKKIRDDKGYWNQIEEYIHAHSEAEFSHGICPDCVKKMYPDLNIEFKKG